MCYDHSSVVHAKLRCYVFGAKASSGLWHLLLAGLLSVHLSWITDLLRELLRRCQKQAAVLETNMPAVAAAAKELQTAPTSCLEQQYFLQFSWSSARLCSSQLGSRADAVLPSKETPIKIGAAW